MLKQYRIGIDPGHGGKDPGAIGPTRLYEKDVTLSVSMELNRLLKQAGLETYITRPDDQTMELITRTALINNMRCDLAISAHVNSTTSQQANYIATFVQGTGGEAEKLAGKVQNELVQATGWPDGGVRVKNLHMTRDTNMPAILVECGFMSNPEQEKQLADPAVRKRIAKAIADGLLDYLGIEEEEKTVTIDEALKVLQEKGITSSPEYWKQAAGVVKHLDSLIINMAEKLQGGK